MFQAEVDDYIDIIKNRKGQKIMSYISVENLSKKYKIKNKDNKKRKKG